MEKQPVGGIVLEMFEFNFMPQMLFIAHFDGKSTCTSASEPPHFTVFHHLFHFAWTKS